jgi:hypothetical protein
LILVSLTEFPLFKPISPYPAQSNAADPLITGYSVEVINLGGEIEYRLKLNRRHFGTLIDQSGALAFRPHPGCDPNGWGTTWYAQPFLPGATLKHTTIQVLAAAPQAVQLEASGNVSRGAADTYGNWQMSLDLQYDPLNQTVSAAGWYTITLAAALSSVTGDLNLYKLASNYLADVPLLNGSFGDTGDMGQANVTRIGYSYAWVPTSGNHFPSDESDFLSIDVTGQFNQVDTQAMGYQPIAAAFKPALKIVLTSQRSNSGMRFGAVYNTGESQCYYCDNVGITPWISRNSTNTVFEFAVAVESHALETCTFLPLLWRQ